MPKRLLLVLSVSLLIAALVAPDVKAGGGIHCDPTITDERTTTVRLAKNCFWPTIARVDVGDEVTFVSEDLGVPHTISGALFAFGDMDKVMGGDERQFTFDEEGIYPYVCIIHPGMAGAIVVGDGQGAGGAVTETSSYRANPPEVEPATDAATRPAAARGQNPWVMGLAALIAIMLAGAWLLPRRRTPQTEI